MRNDTRLVDRLALLRWLVPITVALVGTAYMVFEHAVLEGDSLSGPYAILGIVFLGLIGPALAWLTLTWAGNAAEAEEKAQEEIRRRAMELEAASQTSKKITAILDIDELLNQIVNLVRDTFGYYYVALFLVDADSNELVLREEIGQEESVRASGLRLKIGEHGITGHVAQTGIPFLCNDVSREPRYYLHELVPDTQSELAVPLRLGNAVIGVFDVQSRQLDAFREDDITVLQILADQVAIALENARLFGKTRQQFEVMRVLHDISLDITSRLDSQQVLAAILKQAAHFLNAEASSLSVYDSSTRLVRIVATHNLPPEFKEAAVPLSEGLVGQVVLTGKPIIVNKYEQWEKRSPRFGSPIYDSIVGAPLRWHGEVFGVLGVGDRSERRTFNDNDATLLVLFADFASIALKNSELYEQVVRFSQELEHKVEKRTIELTTAREELARKATQLQSLLAAILHVQEEERARIARDLHDGSNQLITGATYELQAARESLLSQHAEATLEKLEIVKGLLRKIDAENRRIIRGLRPPILDAQGLLDALSWHANTFQQQWSIPCSFQVSGKPIRLPPEVEIAVYRIVQESLNNILAHAHAQHVQINANFGRSEFMITVQDDGVGFDYGKVQAEPSGRMGLIGMNERAQSIGAQMQVESVLGQQTRITLRVPLNSPKIGNLEPSELSSSPMANIS